MKRYFHEELEAVRSHLMLMGEKASANVNLAMRSILESDVSIARKVMESDADINAIEKQIDEEVARYISLRAPVARDLRLLFVAVKAAHDIERVGDEASSIAKRVRAILDQGKPIDYLGSIPRMCELAVNMLQDSLYCFIEEDADRAYPIFKRDNDVDELNRENFRYFVDLMKNDPQLVNTGTEMIFISKSLERIADHAQNLAEEVYYLLTANALKDVIKAQK